MATMFLRTALTEQRIDELERKMQWVIEHFGLKIPDAAVSTDLPDRTRPRIVKPEPPNANHPDLHVPRMRPPDASGADSGGMGQAPAVMRNVRRTADEPRVPPASHRGKRKGASRPHH